MVAVDLDQYQRRLRTELSAFKSLDGTTADSLDDDDDQGGAAAAVAAEKAKTEQPSATMLLKRQM